MLVHRYGDKAVRFYEFSIRFGSKRYRCLFSPQNQVKPSKTPYFPQRTEEGITGRISFNENFERSYFDFDIVELQHGEGLKKIAYWDPIHGINMTRSLSEVYDQVSHSFSNKTFLVASRIGMPFLQWK